MLSFKNGHIYFDDSDLQNILWTYLRLVQVLETTSLPMKILVISRIPAYENPRHKSE